MKWLYTVFSLALLAACAHAEEEVDLDEEGTARLGFITVGTDGSTSLTFNATSIQNAVIVGLFILVLGALLLPLFGAFGEEESSGYGYGYENTGGYSSGYEQQASGYNTYSKRYNMINPPVFLSDFPVRARSREASAHERKILLLLLTYKPR